MSWRATQPTLDDALVIFSSPLTGLLVDLIDFLPSSWCLPSHHTPWLPPHQSRSDWQKRYVLRSALSPNPLTRSPQAAKASTKGSSSAMASTDVSATGTPMTNLSANGSTEDLADSAAAQMAKLSTATDRSANGVLVSDPKSRDIKIDQYSLSFHGRLLIEGAEISLNYGNRYGLLGENGSGKSTFLQSIAERDVEIPEHIDVSHDPHPVLPPN
jgi:ABC-type multidrug transport system fused ATPase/permease subunit